MYDHAHGYDKPLEVEPVCFKCNGKRSKARGEHRVPHRGNGSKMGVHHGGDLIDGKQYHEFPTEIVTA